MERRPAVPQAASLAVQKKRGDKVSKKFWRKIRKPLAQSRFAKAALTSILANFLRLVRLTNPMAAGSSDVAHASATLTPGIITLWHGQHLLAPVIYPRGRGLVAMVSRSADAELNAKVVEKLGIEAVRGSGGRGDSRNADKGGARALIALKKALDVGKNVAMIADIPHGTPRQSGLGVITLAKLSGRPIIPVAIATSRRKVLEKSWDKTAINLPFGRCAIIIGEPVRVDAQSEADDMEAKRVELTNSLNNATAEAYRIVDGGK
jgi:lysophospholipid acyltransferase (LPLAT)-like uncharacterized protein